MELLQQVFVQLGPHRRLQPVPAALGVGHGKEHLMRHQGALVVIGIQRPHRDLAFAARHQITRAWVEIVKAVDLDLPHPVLALAQFHIGLAHQPERLVRGSRPLQILGQQVGVHLRLEQRDAGPVHLVDVLGGLGVEGEGAEQDELRRGAQGFRLGQGQFHLALFEGGMFGAKADDDTFAGVG